MGEPSRGAPRPPLAAAAATASCGTFGATVLKRVNASTQVFSGHVAVAEKARFDTGKSGNRTYSFLTTMHDPTSNSVRLLGVDTTAGTVKTRVHAPCTATTWGEHSETLPGVTLAT